ncbi:hypothetical protein [Caldivirga sp.]|uniref:hypothetical protein n=1 Tax=Caldivirga sp. TaxID=2080243 RepID=UPI0025BEEE2A|nr:hypothetical protein [Caldivirga sp.]
MMVKRISHRDVWVKWLLGPHADRIIDWNSRHMSDDLTIVARRLQTYGGEPVKLPRRLARFGGVIGYCAIKPNVIELLKDGVESPWISLIDYLNGRVNMAVSASFINQLHGGCRMPKETRFTVADRVIIDVDLGEGGLDRVKETADRVVKASVNVLNVEPLILHSGCKGIHIVYFLSDFIEANYLPAVAIGLANVLKFGELGIKPDSQTLTPSHTFRLPYTVNLRCGKVAEFLNSTMDIDFNRHMLPINIAKALALMFNEEKKTTPQVKPQGNRTDACIELAKMRDSGIDVSVLWAVFKCSERESSRICLSNPIIGRVCGPRELLGYGWVKYIVDNGILLPDARHALIWTTLGQVINMGLVARGKAEEWLRMSLGKYPDREGEPIDNYIKELDYYIKYRKGSEINPPTWRTLVTWITKSSEEASPAVRHVAVNVIKALWENEVITVEKPEELKGLVREDAESFNQILKTQLKTSNGKET